MSGPIPRVGTIAFCEGCSRIVMVREIANGLVQVIDPDFRQRRFIRSIFGPATVMRVGFGPGMGTEHQCHADRSKIETQGLYGGDQLEN